MITVERLQTHPPPDPTERVQLKITGNIFEIRRTQKEFQAPILKISKDEYINLNERTGEVKTFQHKQNRAQSPYKIAQSMARLRDLINANLTHPRRCRWVTLTYRENMQDTKRLYDDFRTFNMRLKRRLAKEGLPGYEYIVAMEPQGRGAWHSHCVFIFEGKKAPFLPSGLIEEVWGKGFARVRAIDNVDNVGLYLSAYLGDMEVTEAYKNGLANAGPVMDVKNGEGEERKAVVKGARLALYPPGFHLFRHSRGIKHPKIIDCTEQEAMEIIGDAKLTFEKTIQLTDEQGRQVNVINYRHFNKNRLREHPPNGKT